MINTLGLGQTKNILLKMYNIIFYQIFYVAFHHFYFDQTWSDCIELYLIWLNVQFDYLIKKHLCRQILQSNGTPSWQLPISPQKVRSNKPKILSY